MFLDTHHCHSDFKRLDENNNAAIARNFYLHLLNKDHLGVYDNDASKIYTELKPIAPSQHEANPKNYRLAKISKDEAYFLQLITKREKLATKMQRLTSISNAVGTGLTAAAVVTSAVSTPAFACGWALPLGVALSTMSVLLPLANAASRKLS